MAKQRQLFGFKLKSFEFVASQLYTYSEDLKNQTLDCDYIAAYDCFFGKNYNSSAQKLHSNLKGNIACRAASTFLLRKTDISKNKDDEDSTFFYHDCSV